MKVNQLTHDQLDYWVAKAQQINLTPAPEGQGYLYKPHADLAHRRWSPSRYWSQGGPIIEAAHIDLNWDWESASQWTASLEPDINSHGGTALEAAMRAFVCARFGEELPDGV